MMDKKYIVEGVDQNGTPMKEEITITTMTDAEILKALIEKAWANGWSKINSCYKEEIKYGPLAIWGKKLESGSVRYFPMEEIIFDPEFIKALCRAKYGNDDKLQLGPNASEQIEKGYILPWTWCLSNLAIAPNRLEYLRKEFLC